MDLLSAAASIIAVVQIADRIVALCKAYITGVNDAPTELRAILIESWERKMRSRGHGVVGSVSRMW